MTEERCYECSVESYPNNRIMKATVYRGLNREIAFSMYNELKERFSVLLLSKPNNSERGVIQVEAFFLKERQWYEYHESPLLKYLDSVITREARRGLKETFAEIRAAEN